MSNIFTNSLRSRHSLTNYTLYLVFKDHACKYPKRHIVNPPDGKLVNLTSVQWIEILSEGVFLLRIGLIIINFTALYIPRNVWKRKKRLSKILVEKTLCIAFNVMVNPIHLLLKDLNTDIWPHCRFFTHGMVISYVALLSKSLAHVLDFSNKSDNLQADHTITYWWGGSA